jgi:hypothetical protein
MVESEQGQIETEVSDEFAFNVMSIKKFWILNFLSFGMLPIAWFYINWKKQREIRGDMISPFWRTVFRIFLFVDFAKRIKEQSKDEGINLQWNAKFYAILLFFITVIANLFSQYYPTDTLRDIGISVVGSFLFFIIKGLFLSDWQRKINISADDVKGINNNKITFTNFLWVLASWAFMVVTFIIVYYFEKLKTEGF